MFAECGLKVSEEEGVEAVDEQIAIAANHTDANVTSSLMAAAAKKDVVSGFVLNGNATEEHAVDVVPAERTIETCAKLEDLGRYEQPDSAFQVQYSARIGIMYVPNRVVVDEEQVLVLSFNIQPITDSGSTMYYYFEFAESFLVSRIHNTCISVSWF